MTEAGEQVWYVEHREDGGELQVCLYRDVYRLEIHASPVLRRGLGCERTFRLYFDGKLLDAHTRGWMVGDGVPSVDLYHWFLLDSAAKRWRKEGARLTRRRAHSGSGGF